MSQSTSMTATRFDDLDLEILRRRKSEKWHTHPADVLPALGTLAGAAVFPRRRIPQIGHNFPPLSRSL